MLVKQHHADWRVVRVDKLKEVLGNVPDLLPPDAENTKAAEEAYKAKISPPQEAAGSQIDPAAPQPGAGNDMQSQMRAAAVEALSEIGFARPKRRASIGGTTVPGARGGAPGVPGLISRARGNLNNFDKWSVTERLGVVLFPSSFWLRCLSVAP